MVGTVPLDSFDEPDVRKLARDRRRSSLKKDIAMTMIHEKRGVRDSARSLVLRFKNEW